MSGTDAKLIERIAASGEGLEPQAQWQDAVRRSIKAEPVAMPSRAPLFALAALVVAGAIAIAVLLVQGQDDRAAAKAQLVAMNQALEELHQQMRMAQIDIDMANARMEDAFTQLEAAISEEEKIAAQAVRSQAVADLKAGRQKLQALKEFNIKKESRAEKSKRKSQSKDKINKCINSSDPLCGL